MIDDEEGPTDRAAPPWERKAPKARPGAGPRAPTKLTPEMKSRAEARARAAGRPYPNLVDNMWAARQQKLEADPERDDDPLA